MEFDNAGSNIKKYIYGPGIDEPICIITGSDSNEAVYFYHFDGLGSVTSLTDASGAVVETYSYDDFGKPTIKDAGGNTLTESVIDNEYFFTGRQFDKETGLYFYRARYYSPDTGRFLQRDKIGYYDSMNLYAYVGNNPGNLVDPLGLWSGAGAVQGLINVGTGIVVGAIVAGTVVLLLPQAAAAAVLTGAAMLGSAALGLTTAQVLTGKTLSGKEICDAKRTEMLIAALLGWATLGFGAWKTNAFGIRGQPMVYRQGTFAKDQWKGNFIKGKKWAPEHPLTTPDFAKKYGLPLENSGKPDWIVGGSVRGGYRTGSAPASHNNPGNTGGALEVIPDDLNDVGIAWFHMP